MTRNVIYNFKKASGGIDDFTICTEDDCHDALKISSTCEGRVKRDTTSTTNIRISYTVETW